MKNILFIRLRLLGDIIFTLPAIQTFKANFPDTRTYYVAEEKFADIASLLPGIDETIIIPRKMGIRQLLQFRKSIKAKNIDTVIDFHSGPKSALLSFLSAAKQRIGYKTPNRNWAYTHLTPRKFGNTPTHSVVSQARLLEHLGLTIDNLPQYPQISPSSANIPSSLLELLETGKRMVIHVGAGNRFRDWGIN